MKIILMILFSNIVLAQAIPGTKAIDTSAADKETEDNSVAPFYKYPKDIPVNDSKVYSEVEQKAEYPGGISAFREKLSSTFDDSAMNGFEGTVRAQVTFIIEKDGKITDIKVSGNNGYFNIEVIRVIQSIKTKWTPARINSIRVRYLYELPLSMTFEN